MSRPRLNASVSGSSRSPTASSAVTAQAASISTTTSPMVNGTPRRRNASMNVGLGGWAITRRRPVTGELEHRAVLSDDHVEAGQIARDAAQVGEPSSRHQDDRDPLLAKLGDGMADRWIEHAVDGDRPVVVKRKDSEFHSDSSIARTIFKLALPGRWPST